MKLPICSFETAKQLKEVGFDIKCYLSYRISINSKIDVSDAIPDKQTYLPNLKESISAPTLALVQMWLRENYGIHVHMCIPNDTKWIMQLHKGNKTLAEDSYHNSYETALEAGILECIKLIKTK